MRRGVLVILLATVLTVTAVTGLLQPARVQRSGPWRSVPLKADDVHRLDALGSHQVLVGGRGAGGGPLLAVVDRGEVVRLDVPGDGGIWSQVVTSDVAVVVDDEASSDGPAEWSASGPPGSGGEWTVTGEYERVDSTGRRPDRLWLTEEDEGAAAVGGFLDEEGHLALVPLDWAAATFVDGPPGLYLAADASPADLWVGGSEGSYVVAGPVSATPGATDTGLQVWTTNTMIEFPWTRVELEVLPDVVTDMRGWVLGLYLAGAVGQRPVVLGDHGRALEVPDVTLDPADPTVLLAEIPLRADERASVVLQTPDGAILYRATGEGWDEVALPPGRAGAAVLPWDELDGPVTAYAVVDGTLWWRPLPAAGP